MKLQKYSGNPVLKPNVENDWESLVCTNPGAWYDESIGEVLLLYRAAGKDDAHTISFGLAKSKNGYDFERTADFPVMGAVAAGWDGGSVEDARIVRFGKYYFITYAAVAVSPGQYWLNRSSRRLPKELPEEAPLALRQNMTRTGLAITKDFRQFYRPGYLTDATVDDRDVVIFPEKVNGKFVTLHRPMQWVGATYGTENPAIWMAFSDDLLEQKKLALLAKAEYDWEVKIGGAAPPIKTDEGWLMLYHAVGKDEKYRVGAMLLDLENPMKILHRSTEPILEPELAFENQGIYNGICFPCGNVVIDGTFFVYYGGADQYVGVASCALRKLLDYLRECPAENAAKGESHK